MDISKLVRNSDKVLSTFIIKGDSVATTTGCKIYIPSRYERQHLMDIGQVVNTLGIYAIVVEDKYWALHNVCSRVNLSVDSISKVKVNEEEYYEFTFDKGSVVITNTNLIVNDTLPYYIFNEIINKGKIPWYLDYTDLSKLFGTCSDYSGVSLGRDNAPIEVIVATISRQKDNKTQHYRYQIGDKKDMDKHTPEIIPMRNVFYGATNLASRLIGSHLDAEGLTAALVHPSERNEGVEELLRQ